MPLREPRTSAPQPVRIVSGYALTEDADLDRDAAVIAALGERPEKGDVVEVAFARNEELEIGRNATLVFHLAGHRMRTERANRLGDWKTLHSEMAYVEI